MIKYNLKCHNNHEFESWFSDSNEFDKLNKKKLLDCIYCSSKRITKSIMAPMISVVKKNINNSIKLNKNLASEKENLLKLRRFIENNFEYKLLRLLYFFGFPIVGVPLDSSGGKKTKPMLFFIGCKKREDKLVSVVDYYLKTL